MTNPFIYKLQQNSSVLVIPNNVTSKDTNITYFAFSKHLNTFYSYFDLSSKNQTLNEINIEYSYRAKNLIRSISDFTVEDNYHNFEYNYDQFDWKFKNENKEIQDLELNIEVYFDLGNDFQAEPAYFNEKMNKTIIPQKEIYNINKTVVKYSTIKFLKTNETINFTGRFPLYFENCKNYSLNKVVRISEIVFTIMFICLVYVIYTLIAHDEIIS